MVIIAPESRGYAIIAPDGGWGWVVVAASFYIQLVVDGVLLCFGMLLNEMSTFYDIPTSKIAFIGSITFGSHLFFGPICAGLLKRWGERRTVIIGSFLSGFGLLVAYFRPPHEVLFVSQGIVTGIGLCLANMSSIILTTLYFSNKRIFALGIVVCGTGAGTVVFTLVATYVLKWYGWHNVFLVESMVCFSMALVAFTYIPLTPMEIRTEVGDKSVSTDITIVRIDVSDEEEDGPEDVSSAPEGENRVFYISHPSAISRAVSLESLNSVAEYTDHVLDSYAACYTHAQVPHRKRVHRCCRKCLRRSCPCCAQCLRKQLQIVVMAPRAATLVLDDTKRPSHGVCEIEIEKEKAHQQSRWTQFKEKFQHEVLDLHLLKSCPFLTFCVCGALSYSGIYIVFCYEKVRILHETGKTSDVEEFLILIGSANVICRLLLGFSAFCPRMNFQALNIVGHCLGGLGTVASGLYNPKYFQYSMACAFAFAFGCFAVFAPIILYELVGVHNLQKATGFSMMFNGFFSAMAPWFSGMISEHLKDVNVNFLIAGAMLFISGILFIFITGKKHPHVHHT